MIFMKLYLRRILDDFQDRDLPKPVVRDLKVSELPGKAVVVLGMRRTGKTWFCFQKIQELLTSGVNRNRILYLNFEDDRLMPFTVTDFETMLELFFSRDPSLKQQTCHFFLDEIQRIQGWELFVRRLLDTENIRLWITGSSAKLLGTEIATAMRGRSLSVEVFPFSFREFIRFNGENLVEGSFDGSRQRALLQYMLNQYALKGGFPEAQMEDEDLRCKIIQNYVDVVILRDVVERHRVSNMPALRALIRAILAAPANSFSVNKFHGVLKSLGVSGDKNELYKYISYLHDAYFIHPVEIWSRSLKTRQVNPKKMYACDIGMVRAMSFGITEDRGALLENMVFLHLRRNGVVPDYYVSPAGREVDFIFVTRQRGRHLIQVCWSMDNSSTRKRELAALSDAMQEFKCDTATIVTWAEEGDENGIEIVPVWRWMLRDFK